MFFVVVAIFGFLFVLTQVCLPLPLLRLMYFPLHLLLPNCLFAVWVVLVLFFLASA